MQVILLLAARELLTLLYEFLKFAVDQRYKAESTIRYIHIIKSFKNSFFRKPSIVHEVQIYLEDSFGNSTRIDYGTGHEMAFVMFLACLFHAGIYDIKKDPCAVGLIVFGRYMNLVRKLQITYRMEPAGSQAQLPIFRVTFK